MHRLLLTLMSLLVMMLVASADFVSPTQLSTGASIAGGFDSTITGNAQLHTVRDFMPDRGRIAPAVLYVVARTLADASQGDQGEEKRGGHRRQQDAVT